MIFFVLQIIKMKHHLITKLLSGLVTDFSAISKLMSFVRQILRLGKRATNFVYKLLQYKQHFSGQRNNLHLKCKIQLENSSHQDLTVSFILRAFVTICMEASGFFKLVTLSLQHSLLASHHDSTKKSHYQKGRLWDGNESRLNLIV